MFRTVLPALTGLGIALIGGIYSADWMTNHFDGFDGLTIGAWTAHPQSGSASADPYSNARSARTGKLPLGTAEGLAFYATLDTEGNTLSGKCDYVLSGRTANARLWTLRIANTDFEDLPANDNHPVNLYSRNILRLPDGTMSINVSKSIKPGNWMAIPTLNDFIFILTLYDTSVASSAGITDQAMPMISRVKCHDQ